MYVLSTKRERERETDGMRDRERHRDRVTGCLRPVDRDRQTDRELKNFTKITQRDTEN